MRSITIVFACLLAIYVNYASGLTEPPPRPPSVTDTTRRPDCSRKSPRVCGRNRQGICRRFTNICQLIATNQQGSIIWTHTRDLDCRNVRGGPGATARCYQPCPRDPLICPRVPVRKPLCLISRTNRLCRLVENNCALINLNCQTTPRNQWRRAPAARCRNLVLNDKPRPCAPLPTRTTTEIITSLEPESTTPTVDPTITLPEPIITTVDPIITTLEPIVTVEPEITTVDPTVTVEPTTPEPITPEPITPEPVTPSP